MRYTVGFTRDNISTVTINGLKFICLEYQFNAALLVGDGIDWSISLGDAEYTADHVVSCIRTLSSEYNRGTWTKDLNDNYSVQFENNTSSNSYKVNINKYQAGTIASIDGSTLNTPTSQHPASARTMVFIKNLYDGKLLPFPDAGGVLMGTFNEDAGGTERLLNSFSITNGSAILGSYYWAGGYAQSSIPSFSQDLIDFYNNVEADPESGDHYDDGGISTPSSPAGTFVNTGVDVGLSALPVMDPSASGFMNAFNPDGTQLNAFASYLWNTLDLSSLKLLYSNPMEAVIGLLAVPIKPSIGGTETINVGNIATTCSAPIITNRFAELTCGTVTVPEWWGAYLDYDPYTQLAIYLPYIGVQTLDANDIIGKAVVCNYHVDVLTGACVARLECAGKVLYHFAGQCGVQIPVTASSFGSIVQSILSMGVSAVQSIASQASGNFSSVGEVATSVFNSARTKVQRSGSVGSAAGLMDNQTPYFIIQRPVQCKPADQNQFTGYPAYITYFLKDLKGYTEVEAVRLHDIPATSPELEEIAALLKGGVIL